MSFQAGVFHFDGRPISDWERAAILRSLEHPTCAAPSSHAEPGLLLSHAASRFGGEIPESAQPYRANTSVITFDGRLDNCEDLLLCLRDVVNGEAGEAALALAVYEQWGRDGLVRLIGDWSLAIWDAASRAIVLASDFAGIRPLYYCVSGKRVFWSTRLKLLVDWVDADQIDDAYVGGLLLFGGCPHRTPYRGVFAVPPGHSVVLSNGEATVQAFWQPPVCETIRYQRESDYEEHLRALFREAVQRRLRASGPVLCELSGGLDSSSVVCMASHLIRRGGPNASRVITLSFQHEGSLDERFYKAVEKWCEVGSIHVSTAAHPYLTEDQTGETLPAFWESLLRHAATSADRLRAETYMTGKLGDLIMGNWWDDSAQVAGLLREGHIALALQQSLSWSKVLRIPIYWVLWRACLASLPPSLARVRPYELTDGAYPAKSTEDSIAPDFRRRAGIEDRHKFFPSAWKQARPERRKHLRTLIEQLQLRKLQAPEPLEHLHYTHPFAHRPLVTFMLSVPAHVVCRPGEPRRLMRRAFAGLWPPELHTRRSKDSFAGVFLDSLRPLAVRLLDPGEQLQVVERGYVDPVDLKDRLERLTHSLECNESQLRQIILLEYWLRAREKRLRSGSESLSA